MVSKNKLLGSGIEVEDEKEEVKIDEELGWTKHLYHIDCPEGKDFATFPEQNKAKLDGWVESPADLKEETFKSIK